MKIVKNKQEATKLYKSGAFGNMMPMWTYKEYMLEHKDEVVVVRYKDPASNFYTEEISGDDVFMHVRNCCEHGAKVSDFTFQPTTDDSKVLLNAEYSLGHSYYPGQQIRYSLLQKKMRAALSEESKYAYGLIALMLVKHYMNEYSFDDFQELVNEYPESVFEFTVWSDCIGNVAGRNAIVWEIRNY